MTSVRSVLHLSTADGQGGSARSAYKIHSGLSALGVRSHMIVAARSTSDPNVAPISRGLLRLADRVAGKACDRVGLQYAYFPSSRRLFRHRWFEEADVVQIYNTHGGFLSLGILPELCRRKAVVWRLSDMWPLTGHCAHAGDCLGWKRGCGDCPDLATYPAISWDSTRLLWRWKQHLYRRSKFHVVSTNAWMDGLVAQSPLLGTFPRSIIPNGIDVDVYKPRPREACLGALGISGDVRWILFAASRIDDPEKGLASVCQAIRALAHGGRRDLGLLLVGDGRGLEAEGLPCPVWRHSTRDDLMLASIYGAADVYVHAATRENLPNTVLEALACEVPTVAFDVGGIRDAVEPSVTGLLATPNEPGDLAAKISALLCTEGRAAMVSAGRARVLARYSLEAQTTSFAKLYDSLI